MMSALLFAKGSEQISSFPKALNLSKINKKPIFYFHSSISCSYCEKQLNLINENKNVKSFLNREFIFLKLNKEEGLTPLSLNDSFTPVFFILNENGEVLFKHRGFLNKIDFIKFANLGKYKAKYNKGK